MKYLISRIEKYAKVEDELTSVSPRADKKKNDPKKSPKGGNQ